MLKELGKYKDNLSSILLGDEYILRSYYKVVVFIDPLQGLNAISNHSHSLPFPQVRL